MLWMPAPGTSPCPGSGAGMSSNTPSPTIAPAIVPKLFSVNRPLLSSKLRRLPLRGMLGNGLRVVAGAVAASQGSLVVETRGRRLVLHIDDTTGLTSIDADEPIPLFPGTVVRVALGNGLHFRGAEGEFIRPAIRVARLGRAYDGAVVVALVFGQ